MHADEFALHAALEDGHWWFRARRNVMLTVLKRFAPEQRGHLLEIGCGTGGNLKFLHGYFSKVTGVDAAEAATRFAAQRVAGEIYCGDFRAHLAPHWREYDVVLLADVLEHVPDDANFLRDIVRSLRPGAFVLITVPAHPSLWSAHDVALGHQRRYTQAALRTLWKDLPVREHFFSPFMFVLSPLVALARWLRPNAGADNHSDLSQHSRFANAVLYFVFNLDSLWLRWFRLPFGCSYITLLERTHDGR